MEPSSRGKARTLRKIKKEIVQNVALDGVFHMAEKKQLIITTNTMLDVLIKRSSEYWNKLVGKSPSVKVKDILFVS